ncbi:methyltransferase [Streptomyces sp. NPDC005955]|uniref:methyltransferase n=1 Tax=Streptomyces sp. NPDC005955 TaxID=3364738 RepID=UPI0036CD94F7
MSSAKSAESLASGLLEHALSAACAASVRAAVTLGLPEVLGDAPATVEELATAVGADPAALQRLLRALTSYEVFAQDGEGAFVHTEKSLALREDSPHSLKHLVLWCTEPWLWSLWGRLDESVRTGNEVFTQEHGRKFYEHLHTRWPESAKTFDRAMTQQTGLSAAVLADLLPLSGVDTIADVGGGQGLVLATVLERHPGLQGFLLDLPDVVANADARMHPGGALAHRVQLVPGDCLQEVPVQADLYLFKNILGVDEERSVLILRNAVEAARPGARMVIVDNFVDADGPGQQLASAMDLRMLLVIGGRKHTRAGLLTIAERAGLIVHGVRPVDSSLHMIEATVPE